VSVLVLEPKKMPLRSSRIFGRNLAPLLMPSLAQRLGIFSVIRTSLACSLSLKPSFKSGWLAWPYAQGLTRFLGYWIGRLSDWAGVSEFDTCYAAQLPVNEGGSRRAAR
jgi:hypothetical protein